MSKKPVQLKSGTWYIEKFQQTECCDCGLVHDVDYRLEKGRLLTQWSVNEKETAKVRRDQGITVRRKKAVD